MGLLGKKDDTQSHLQACVFKAVALMEQRYHDPPTAMQLAAHAGMSLSHFHKAFQLVVGESVAKHQLRLRVERAASYLSFSNWQMGDIGLVCGFDTQASFSRAFKRVYGITPRQFRKGSEVRPYMRGDLRGRQPDPNKPRRPVPTVRLETWSELPVVCLRCYCAVDEVHKPWIKLLKWAKEANLELDKARFFGLWFDDFSGQGTSFRYECSLVLPGLGASDVPAPFFTRVLPAGTMAITHAQGSLKEVERSWQDLVLSWLPQSGYQPSRDYAFDEYPLDLMMGHPLSQLATCLLGRLSVRLCLPVQSENYQLLSQ